MAIVGENPSALTGDGALDDAEAQRLISAFAIFSHDEGADVDVVDESLLEVLQVEEQKVDDAVKILSDGAPVDTLSPGGRSSAMLPLIAMAETVPLIIDQPEDNLDPKSIFDELVGRFVETRHRRQIIIVTHNANLVVNADVDQVIVASCTKHRGGHPPEFSYVSGGLEDEMIREHVCKILEGGETAFKERARRLRVSLGR